MVEVIFSYEGTNINIQCNINEKLKDIVERFLNKIKDNKYNINSLYLYNGNEINFELTFNEQANNIDKKRKIMNIVVTNNNSDSYVNEKKQTISTDIICPICKENIFIDIKNFKINLTGCKNNHFQNNILLYLFEESQKIDLSKIICDICNKNNKKKTHNNEFYICNTCNKNLCPLCKTIHNQDHLIINYDKKKYICQQHNESFNKFCETCKENICIICENNHIDHKIFELGKFLVDKKDLTDTLRKLRNNIDKLKYKINLYIEVFNQMTNLLDAYYKINDNIIKNYNINKRNYHKLHNLNYLNNNNKMLINEINKLDDNAQISEIYNFCFNNFYNVNGEKFIGKIKNGLKEGEGILYYDKDNEKNRARYEGDFKNDKPNGKGIMYWNFGDKYEGDWKNDIIEGKGIYHWINGGKYEGDFKNGKREGKGLMHWSENEKYEGDWKNDQREGIGVKYWENGDKYDGHWKNDKKEGKGIMFFNNGNKYDGDWKNGITEGKGIYFWNTGERYEGNWKMVKEMEKGNIFGIMEIDLKDFGITT